MSRTFFQIRRVQPDGEEQFALEGNGKYTGFTGTRSYSPDSPGRLYAAIKGVQKALLRFKNWDQTVAEAAADVPEDWEVVEVELVVRRVVGSARDVLTKKVTV